MPTYRFKAWTSGIAPKSCSSFLSNHKFFVSLANKNVMVLLWCVEFLTCLSLDLSLFSLYMLQLEQSDWVSPITIRTPVVHVVNLLWWYPWRIFVNLAYQWYAAFISLEGNDISKKCLCTIVPWVQCALRCIVSSPTTTDKTIDWFCMYQNTLTYTEQRRRRGKREDDAYREKEKRDWKRWRV